LDVSISKHGFVPKAPNDTSKYLRGDGTWSYLGTPDVLIFKGTIDCSTNPNYPAADAGNTYLVSVAGRIGGASGPAVEVGDMLVCCVDSSASGDHATVGANWTILQSIVTETNLTLSDVTTLNVDATKHGFVPKTPNDTTKFFRGDATWNKVDESGINLSDVTTNDASITKHGFAPKATAPAAGVRNILAIDNGESGYKNTPLLDTTNPTLLGTLGPGSSLLEARQEAGGGADGCGAARQPGQYLLHIGHHCESEGNYVVARQFCLQR